MLSRWSFLFIFIIVVPYGALSYSCISSHYPGALIDIRRLAILTTFKIICKYMHRSQRELWRNLSIVVNFNQQVGSSYLASPLYGIDPGKAHSDRSMATSRKTSLAKQLVGYSKRLPWCILHQKKWNAGPRVNTPGPFTEQVSTKWGGLQVRAIVREFSRLRLRETVTRYWKHFFPDSIFADQKVSLRD